MEWCLTQITQSIGSRITNSHTFRLPSISLPRENGTEEPENPNSIDDICQDIDTGIQQAVQENLSNLNRDAKAVKAAVAKAFDAEANISSRRPQSMELSYGSLQALSCCCLRSTPCGEWYLMASTRTTLTPSSLLSSRAI